MSTSSGDPGQQGWGPPQQQGYSYGQGSGYPGSPGYGGYQQAPGYGEAPGTATSHPHPLASRGRRLGGHLLDGLLYALLLIPLVVVFVVLLVTGTESTAQGGEVSGAAVVLGLLVLYGGAFLLLIAYFVWWPVRTNGQTPAKQVLDMRAVREDGQEFGWSTSIIRALVYSFLGWISGIFVLFDDRHRALHDMASSTVVLDERH